MQEIDKQFDNTFFKENIIKQSEKLPYEIKINLEKGKKIINEWEDDNKCIFLINESLNIEKNIENIQNINDKMENYYSNNIKIKFNPDENDENLNNFLNSIKSFGEIYDIEIDFKYIIKHCPINIKESKRYLVSGENNNILTKIGKGSEWTGAICEKDLEKNNRHSWKIKILKSQNHNIMVGVAPIDFDYNSSDYTKCGWYINCKDSSLYSGPPYNFIAKYHELNNSIEEEIIVILDLEQRTLGFSTYKYEEEICYTEIPMNKLLVPVILLYDENDSVEIISEDE